MDNPVLKDIKKIKAYKHSNQKCVYHPNDKANFKIWLKGHHEPFWICLECFQTKYKQKAIDEMTKINAIKK